MPVASLFSPLRLGGLEFRNRVFVSPMCEYSSDDGFANDWHLVHLGSRAVGGASLVLTEAAAVTPEGRITPEDLGIWKDEHIPELKRIVGFLHAQGAYAGIQIAHAGRKASMRRPWETPQGVATAAEGGWPDQVLAPSDTPFAPDYVQPHALDPRGLARITAAFVAAAKRASEAGFDVLEIHAAHGYLFHEFLSPLSNHRTDAYGGSRDNRMRLLLETAEQVRAVWRGVLFTRISGTDWTDGGWTVEDSVALARELKSAGVELIDVSSGGNVPHAEIPVGPGYQVELSARVRHGADIPTATVGMITDSAQADTIIRTGQADAVCLAREFLREPYWPLKAAQELGVAVSWPPQYLRAAPRGSAARTPVTRPELR